MDPRRAATVIHGDGETIDGFADIVIVNYEILDRHVGWLGNHGFRGMVVDEAHFIKNKSSQRSQHVLALSERIQDRNSKALLMALTGTPLINDIEDFRAIWQFLGWIDDKPRHALMAALEATGLTPADPGSTRRAPSVIDLGIVRRRKVDVASDIPARRVADLPVELDDEAARSIRAAEQELARRLVARYQSALAARKVGTVIRYRPRPGPPGRCVGAQERRLGHDGRQRVHRDARDRAGQGRPGRRLCRPAGPQRRQGRLLRQARRRHGCGGADVRPAGRRLRLDPRGPDPEGARKANIEAFLTDPEVAVVVCSLTAAGVGLNLGSPPTSCSPSCRGPRRSRRRPSARCTGSARPSRSPPRRIIATQTIDGLAQLIDDRRGSRPGPRTAPMKASAPRPTCRLEALISLLTEALHTDAAVAAELLAPE